jgi:hypothetical protein
MFQGWNLLPSPHLEYQLLEGGPFLFAVPFRGGPTAFVWFRTAFLGMFSGLSSIWATIY